MKKLSLMKTGRQMSLVVVLALFAAASFASSPHAAAASGTSMCMTFGNGYCLNVQALTVGSGVITKNGPGRTIEWDPSGGTFDEAPTGVLKFSNTSNLCIIAGSGGSAQAGQCSGVTGDVWARFSNAGNSNQWIYINKHYSSGAEEVLSCRNIVGSLCDVEDAGTSGAYQVFSFFQQS